MTEQTPQTNFEDQQNFSIDIEKVYTDIISQVDAMRSYVNITNKNNQDIIKANTKSSSSLASIRQRLKIESTPQESRCHAFFRLIGFPVCGANNVIYNPGFDKTYSANKIINNDYKIQVSNSLIPGFRDLSIFREIYLTDILKIFSSNESIDASALALSLASIRGFASTSEKVKTEYAASDDFKKTDQSYEAELYGLVGQYPGKIPFSLYKDISGNSPKLSATRYHIIFPFMVDPWIDFSVSPTSRLVAVPFVYNKKDLRISENTFVNRPLIEKIIRDRYTDVSTSQESSGDWSFFIQNLVKDIPSIKDVEIVKLITSDNQQVEQEYFYKYLNIIIAMMTKLHTASTVIKSVQSKYYWLPIPSVTGPEGGVSTRSIMSQISKEVADNKLITPADNDLISAIIKRVLNQSNAQTSNINGSPDKGNFVSEPMKTFTPETTDAYGDNNANIVEKLSKNRSSEMEDAGKALRDIEIIMGEFSGFGLCDIIAIMGALYIMPKDLLLGFLDDDAFIRARVQLNNIEITKQPDFSKTLASFTEKVKDFYILMDKIYTDRVHNNNLP